MRGSAPAKVGAGSAATTMEMVVEWAAATVGAEMARAMTVAATEAAMGAAAKAVVVTGVAARAPAAEVVATERGPHQC